VSIAETQHRGDFGGTQPVIVRRYLKDESKI
jgi:hypothetical protein